MNIALLFKEDLNEEERDLIETLGEAFAYTNHNIYLNDTETDRPFAKGYAAGLNSHPITYVHRGILKKCEKVILYVTPETIAMIDSRDAWGTAVPVMIPGLPALRMFTQACVAETKVGPESSSNLSTKIPTPEERISMISGQPYRPN